MWGACINFASGAAMLTTSVGSKLSVLRSSNKTRKPQLAATKDIGELFDYPDLPVKLRQDLCVLTRHQRVVINKLRAQIPEAKNSDARNAIQEITDLLIHRNNQIEKVIEGVLTRKIQVYHKARKIKAEARVDQG
ncbi:hypothetical protein DYB28_004066 [Aphanomyces astaci]|uniref:Uncharacterized protein n=1 Tax=Aphanomyces astaci TaxID=112090 RepID=A0A9X8HBL6_APHAT|nr:hypothetical protein DYB28_004066 [Aphanomyces astaci]